MVQKEVSEAFVLMYDETFVNRNDFHEINKVC